MMGIVIAMGNLLMDQLRTDKSTSFPIHFVVPASLYESSSSTQFDSTTKNANFLNTFGFSF